MPLTTTIVYQFSSEVPEGEVISQDPAADEIVDVDTEVTIYVSLGAEVGGMDVSPAQLTIEGGEISMRINYGAHRAYFVERSSIAVMRAA